MYGAILLPLSFQAINLQQPYNDNDSIYKIVFNRKYKYAHLARSMCEKDVLQNKQDIQVQDAKSLGMR